MFAYLNAGSRFPFFKEERNKLSNTDALDNVAEYIIRAFATLFWGSRHFLRCASQQAIQQSNGQSAMSLKSDIRNLTGGNDFESKSRFC